MARQTEQYNSLSEATTAKLRTAQRHLDGWRPLHTTKTRTGYEIIWSNDVDPIPPRRQLTQRQLLEELKPSDVDII